MVLRNTIPTLALSVGGLCSTFTVWYFFVGGHGVWFLIDHVGPPSTSRYFTTASEYRSTLTSDASLLTKAESMPENEGNSYVYTETVLARFEGYVTNLCVFVCTSAFLVGFGISGVWLSLSPRSKNAQQDEPGDD